MELAQIGHGYTEEKGLVQDLEFWGRRWWNAMYDNPAHPGPSRAGESWVFGWILSCRHSGGTQAHSVKANVQNISKSLFLCLWGFYLCLSCILNKYVLINCSKDECGHWILSSLDRRCLWPVYPPTVASHWTGPQLTRLAEKIDTALWRRYFKTSACAQSIITFSDQKVIFFSRCCTVCIYLH